MGSFPLWILAIVAGQSPSIYSLVFGCDVGTLGLILVFVSVADVFMNFVAGYVQDREYLSMLFPIKSWGRRSPWYATHMPLCILCTCLFFLPPQSSAEEPTFITYLWFGVLALVAKWTTTICFVAVGSASDELFPAQSERVQIYGWRILTIWTSVMIAVVAVNLVIGDSDNSPDRCCAAEFEDNLPGRCEQVTNGTNVSFVLKEESEKSMSTSLTMSLVCVGASLLGFFAVAPLRLAQQPADVSKIENFRKNAMEFFRQPSFVYLFMVALLDTTAGQILTVVAPFFMTLVIALDRKDYATVLILATFSGMIAQLAGSGICVWLFGTTSESSKTTSVNPRMYAFVSCLLFAATQPVLIELCDGGYEDDGETKREGNYAYIVLAFASSRVLLAPLRTWGACARGWLIDMDVQRKSGRRREATINGLLLVAINVGGIVAMLVLTSISWAGIDTRSCWGENQSKAGVRYVKLIFQFGIPVMMLIAALFVWLFPIHGNVLVNLEKSQRSIFVKTPTMGEISLTKISPEDTAAEGDREKEEQP